MLEISDFKIEIKNNLIGFKSLPLHDYYDDYKLKTAQIKKSFIQICTKYKMKETFKSQINLILRNGVGLYYCIFIGCYYLNYLEKNNVNILNVINEIKKHKNDFDYLYSYFSVLQVAYYFTKNNIKIEFLKYKKNQKGSYPDIVVWRDDQKITVDVKTRGIRQIIKLIKNEFLDILLHKKSPVIHSFYEESENELRNSWLLNVIEKGFQQADIVIINHTPNFFGTGGLFLKNFYFDDKKFSDSFIPKKDLLIFYSHHKGKFSFIEFDLNSLINTN